MGGGVFKQYFVTLCFSSIKKGCEADWWENEVCGCAQCLARAEMLTATKVVKQDRPTCVFFGTFRLVLDALVKALSLSLSVCNCFKDRLPDRHSCLNLYPYEIKVQPINQSINQSISQSISQSVSLSLPSLSGNLSLKQLHTLIRA